MFEAAFKQRGERLPPLEEEEAKEVKIFPRNEEIKTTQSETKDSHTHTGTGEKKKRKEKSEKKKTHILPVEEERDVRDVRRINNTTTTTTTKNAEEDDEEADEEEEEDDCLLSFISNE